MNTIDKNAWIECVLYINKSHQNPNDTIRAFHQYSHDLREKLE